ncbi:MAG: protein-glutamate O-methyltransferase CheR [Acidobacteria bacterium]|nr:protein-glutamate O-methyltransferase CheR [Acidobacteriota bacterium]
MSATFAQPPVGDPCFTESYSRVILKQRVFQEIGQIVYKACGIRLVHGKEELVRSRLLKRLRALGLPNFEVYMHYVKDKKNEQELKVMIESLTTNKTSFFRENPHFEYMRTSILPGLIARGSGVRIWSAGCSSGEEPYSIAILLDEEWPCLNRSDLRILATDISTPILEKARKGEYEKELLMGIPAYFREKYFSRILSAPVPTFRINDSIKKMVRFANLNLMAPWPMKGSFDLIFCRNVMIYFDHATQQELVRRFYDILVPGGYLMVGHSESLIASDCDLKYIRPATYMRE